MNSIQSALLSRPLPLSESAPKSHTSSAKPKFDAQDPEKAAKDFEGVFSSMLLKEMRKTLEPGSLFGQDSADVYGGLFDQFMGEHLAASGGMGLAKMVSEALVRSQGTFSASAASAVTTN